jgi:hypothetical protein
MKPWKKQMDHLFSLGFRNFKEPFPVLSKRNSDMFQNGSALKAPYEVTPRPLTPTLIKKKLMETPIKQEAPVFVEESKPLQIQMSETVEMQVPPEQKKGNEKIESSVNEDSLKEIEYSNVLPSKKKKKGKSAFKYLNLFLMDFFLLRTLKQSNFIKLTPFDKEVMCLIFKRLFRNKKFSVSHMTLLKLQQLQKLVTKKRNEEKIKQIWKRFIKNEFTEYCSNEFSVNVLNIEGSFSKADFKDDWKRFFVYFFQEIIRKKKQFPFDMVLDICAEKAFNKTTRPACEDLGQWRTKAKFGMMRKVSASFRYLVSQCPNVKAKFLKFLEEKTDGNIISIMKGITLYKINRIFSLWGVHFCKLKYDKKQFIIWLKNSCNNPKFKLPWMMSDITEAIKYCIVDLESDKLFNEFKTIRAPYLFNRTVASNRAK